MTPSELRALVGALDTIYREHREECRRAEAGALCFECVYYERAALDAADRWITSHPDVLDEITYGRGAEGRVQ
jgi:hypothetical protein